MKSSLMGKLCQLFLEFQALKKQNSVFGLRNISEYEDDDDDDGYNARHRSMKNVVVTITDANFSWLPSSDNLASSLHVSHLNIKKGKH